jgi:hypothetical protein
MREPVSEQSLFWAYRNDPAVLALRVRKNTEWKRPCACRGIVVADPEDPTQGVAEHNATTLHQLWRAER